MITGTWMIVTTYGGWSFYFLQIPWLAGMVVLFAFEFIEGNTITRVYFVKLWRLTKVALETGGITPELEKAREQTLPTFTHFLDLPLYLTIVSLGAMKQNTWTLFFAAITISGAIGIALTIVLPRFYPWSPTRRAATAQ